MSEVRVNTISEANGTGPVTLTKQITVKSFEMHDDDETTIIESFNMSSITDGDTGLCSPVFTNNMATVNYVTAVDGNYNLANGNYTAGSANGLEIYRQITTTAYDHIAASSGNTFDFKYVLSCNLGELA